MDRLIEIMDLLRSPRGCPWDREQTHHSLKPYVIEEAYELLEAIDNAVGEGKDDDLIEELGDLLLQVVFHAQIAQETGRFEFKDVVDAICNKLVRRHPHVFENRVEMDTDAVTANWEAIKKKEKGIGDDTSGSILDGIPSGLPALSLAKEIQRRAAKVGFEWDTVHGAMEKVAEEAQEIIAIQDEIADMQGVSETNDQAHRDEARAQRLRRRLEEEWGDLFFALVNVARYCDIDSESALFGATKRFQSRFQHVEREAKRAGRTLETMTLEEMDALWDEAKKIEREKQ